LAAVNGERRRCPGARIGILVVALLGTQTFAGETMESPAPRRAVFPSLEVEVSERPVPGFRAPEVSARTVVDAPAALVYRAAGDYDAFARFVPNVRSSRVVRQAGSIRWVHQVLRLPWPFSDREYVIRVRHHTPDGARRGYRIEWKIDPVATAELAGHGTVVPRVFDGRWAIRAVGSGPRTDATYTALLDPAGSLPGWLIRYASRRMLPEVVAAVAKRARFLASGRAERRENNEPDAGR